MNTPASAYYSAQFLAGEWCVAHLVPGTTATWAVDTPCANERTAERVAGHMNAERDASRQAERATTALLLGGAFA